MRAAVIVEGHELREPLAARQPIDDPVSRSGAVPRLAHGGCRQPADSRRRTEHDLAGGIGQAGIVVLGFNAWAAAGLPGWPLTRMTP